MSDGLFAGDHGPEGAWQTLKGKMMEPHIQMPMESKAMNRGGVESGTNDPGWDSHIIVNTGLTHGGGAMAV